MLPRLVAVFVAGILMITSNIAVAFPPPTPLQDEKTINRLRTEAMKFSGGVERVRVWLRDNVDFAGWVDQVGIDSFGFTDEATLQEKSVDFRQVEKIAKDGHKQPLFRWRWDQLPKTLVGSSVALTTTDGLRLEGRVGEISSTEMTVDVKKTSDKQRQSKGNAVLPRGFITSVRVNAQQMKGRIVGVATGAGLGGLFAYSARVNTQSSMGVTDNEAAGIFGVTVGVFYLIGWLADRNAHRNEAVILLMPE